MKEAMMRVLEWSNAGFWRVIDKFLSGRFVLTLAAAYVFVVLSIAGKIEAKDALTIIGVVFTLYFTRSDRQNKGGSNA